MRNKIHTFLFLCIVSTTIHFKNLWAVEYQTSTFQTDYSGQPADTFNIATLMDSLSTAVESTQFLSAQAPIYLNDNSGMNGVSGGNPVAFFSADRTFSVAYVSWTSQEVAQSTPGYVPPPANIVRRSVTVGNGIATIGAGDLLAQSENPLDTTGLFYQSGTPTPPPSYLNYAVEGSDFVSYWSTLYLDGSLRRTSDNDRIGKGGNPVSYGEYIPIGSPDVLGYLGTLGMSIQPGSSADKTVVAYEITRFSASAIVRWEDLAADTSIADTIPRPGTSEMLDFAVGVDSSGNSLILWREGSVLYGKGYDSTRSTLMNVSQVVPTIYQEPLLGHSYRQYGVAAVKDSTFIITYGKGSSIFYRTVEIASGTPLGTEVEITPGCTGCVFPNVSVSENYIVFAWYGNHLTPAGTRQVEGARFERNLEVIQTSTRQDITLSGSDIAFNVGVGQQPWHNYRVPSIAINDSGDVVAAYDEELGARMTAWSDRNIYYDTASFTSRVIEFSQPGVLYTIDPLIDSMELIQVQATPSSNISVQIALADSLNFTQPADTFFNVTLGSDLTDSTRSTARYFKYKVILESSSSGNLQSPTVHDFSLMANIKPHTTVIESLKATPQSPGVLYDSNLSYSFFVRSDTFSVIARAFDMDEHDRFIFWGDHASNTYADSINNFVSGGVYRGKLVFPSFSTITSNVQYEIQAEDSLGWRSDPVSFTIDYRNPAPNITPRLLRKDSLFSSFIDTIPILLANIDTLPVRDTSWIDMFFSDSNDALLQLNFWGNGVLLKDSTISDTNGIRIPFIHNTPGTIPLRIRVADPDTAIDTTYQVHFLNTPPTASVRLFKHPTYGAPNYDTLNISSGMSYSMIARDSGWLEIDLGDKNDDTLRIQLLKGLSIKIDTVVVGQTTTQIPLFNKFEGTNIGYTIRVSDPDAATNLNFNMTFTTGPPLLSTSVLRDDPPGSGIIDTTHVSDGDTAFTFVRDTADLYFEYFDLTETNLRAQIFQDTNLLMDSLFPGPLTSFFPLYLNASSPPVEHRLVITDPDTSFTHTIYIGLKNAIPEIFHRAFKNIPGDLNGTYDFQVGGTDTFQLSIDTSIFLPVGDTMDLQIHLLDTVDNPVQLTILRDTQTILDTPWALGDTLNWPIYNALDTGTALYTVRAADPDTQSEHRFYVIPNNTPKLLSILSLRGIDTVSQVGPIPANQDLSILPLEPMSLLLSYEDKDTTRGDSVALYWEIWNRPISCPVPLDTCLTIAQTFDSINPAHTFQPGEEFLYISLIDSLGAFYKDTFHLTYPYIDTSDSNQNQFASQLAKLNSSDPFILESDTTERLDTITFTNKGTQNLIIDSMKTGVNNFPWLQYEIQWEKSPGQEQVLLSSDSTQKPISEFAISLKPSKTMSIFFYFNTAYLRGDSSIQDTLFLHTNDFHNPILKIPFQLAYVDLPTVHISHDTLSSNSLNKIFGLSKSSSSSSSQQDILVLAFSEPILDSTIDTSSVKVYSRLDSITLGSIQPIPSVYPNYVRRTYGVTGGTIDSSIVDTLWFIPDYQSPSSALGLQPPSGQFIQGDQIQVHLVNSITDTAGNPLNFTLQKIASVAGTKSASFGVLLDTNTLEVDSVYPSLQSQKFDIERPIEIYFNRNIVYDYFHNVLGETATSVDTSNLRGDSNTTISVRSTLNTYQEYSIKDISIERGDSAIFFRTSPALFGNDSVIVRVSSRVGDGEGLSLDGNQDGLGRFLYDPNDVSDFYEFSFKTPPKKFVVYPNPFKYKNPLHRQKQSISFSNLNSLSGVEEDSELFFRIYTMNGDLVYSSEQKKETPFIMGSNQKPEWDWFLTNLSGNPVATGVYVYMISVKGKGRVKKGKVAVIR